MRMHSYDYFATSVSKLTDPDSPSDQVFVGFSGVLVACNMQYNAICDDHKTHETLILYKT